MIFYLVLGLEQDSYLQSANLVVHAASEFGWAKEFNRLRVGSPELRIDNLAALGVSPEQRRYVSLLKTVREIANEMDPRGAEAMEQYRLALLRYSAHTLSFGEPNMLQRRLALNDSAELSRLIREEDNKDPH